MSKENFNFLVALKDTIFESINYKAGQILVNGDNEPLVFESISEAEQSAKSAEDPSAWMVTRHPSAKTLDEAGFTNTRSGYNGPDDMSTAYIRGGKNQKSHLIRPDRTI